MFIHMREARFSGKDGGVGWGAFYEDLLVALCTVDRELEEAVKKVTDLKGGRERYDHPGENKGGS